MTKVSESSAEALAMADEWPLIDALMSGTRAMRRLAFEQSSRTPGECGIVLMRNEAETLDDYRKRVARAVLYPAFKRTVRVLAGKPFSKPISYSADMPPRVRDCCERVDPEGRNLHRFAQDALTQALAYGVCHILVDYPDASGVQSLAEERAAGMRPYMCLIHPRQVLGWRVERRGAAMRLTQVRIMEAVTEPDGEFGERSVPQVRVLEPGTWRVFRQAPGREEWALHSEGSVSIAEIPLATIYAGRTGYMTGKSPLDDLAHLNVKHFQSASEQQTILHVARVPMLVVIGADPDKPIVVGAKQAVELPLQADMRYVEHGGSAIGAGETDLQRIEEQMRAIGAEMLVIRPGTITATQSAAENDGGRCVLQEIGQNLEDALDTALGFLAQFLGEPVAGSIHLFDDYGVPAVAGVDLQQLVAMAAAGRLSDETLYNEMQRRGVISDDHDWSDERDRLSEQGPALGGITDATA